MIAPLLALLLRVTPVTGLTYTVSMRGAPHQRVALRATGVPAGWVASFCTARLCSPFAYALDLDGHGAGRIDLRTVRTGSAAPRRIRLWVQAPGAKAVLVLTGR